MKKFFLIITFLFNLAVNAQVRFDIDFESGSAGKITQIDSVYIRTSEKDSSLHLSYIFESRFDPQNPVDTALPPSARWFYFRMTGAKNKYIYFDFKHTDPLRAVYSYDNCKFERFEENEAKIRKIYKFFDSDTVYIAYFIPYTNSFLQSRIDKWKQHKDADIKTFGYSFHNQPMQLLTITDQTISDENKYRIWIHARTHTSETPSSWHLDGLIETLLAENKNAEIYRKSFVFYIVPFANPDGVFEGLSRSNATGVNQEINWDKDELQTVVEVKNIKRQIKKLTETRPFDLVLNMHSQVANNATYWIHTAETTNEKFLSRQLLLCYLNMFDNSYLSPDELSFSKMASRYPEGWIWNNFGDKTVAMTFETPYTYFGASNIWLNTENLRDFGKSTLDAIAMYFGICTPDRIILDNENANMQGKWEKVKSDKMLYFGENYLSSQKRGSKITYKHKKLPIGKYKIYKWNAGESGETPVANMNQWIFIDTYEQKKTSNFKYKFKPKSSNENFDAIMLIKTKDYDNQTSK
ncbi:MAG: hypothetical protein LBE11_02750 [Prevotellaceae bacterium]|jgi:hypothetical protein|nr:hypothetical protein [Prevotellaceae bacterium]